MTLLTPRYFLIIGGVILLALGVYGFIYPQPVSDTSVVHFDVWENYIHTLAGVGMLAIGFLLPGIYRMYRWWTTLAVGLAALAFAIIGFAVSGRAFPNLGGANLENPFDNLVNLAIAAYALFTVLLTRREALRKPVVVEEKEEKRMEEPPRMPKAA